jgi:hypothetical protein
MNVSRLEFERESRIPDNGLRWAQGEVHIVMWIKPDSDWQTQIGRIGRSPVPCKPGGQDTRWSPSRPLISPP